MNGLVREIREVLGRRMELRKEDIAALRSRVVALREEAAEYFATARPTEQSEGAPWQPEISWEIEDTETLRACEALRQGIKELGVEIAGAARGSPLLSEADMQELRQSTRQMLANVRFREYRHTGVYVHHDEDVVLGVDPASHEEVPFGDASAAANGFDAAAAAVLDLTDLLLASDGTEGMREGSASFRPNTAFLMMAIEDGNPELEDIRTGIKEVFGEFGVEVIAADEIEHEEAITDRILAEIDGSEFLIADLTHERPNVYYEIGHAHALSRRVILVRKKGTKLHFDVAHRNCPEYENATGLKRLLRKRLEAVTNKRGPAGGRSR